MARSSSPVRIRVPTFFSVVYFGRGTLPQEKGREGHYWGPTVGGTRAKPLGSQIAAASADPCEIGFAEAAAPESPANAPAGWRDTKRGLPGLKDKPRHAGWKLHWSLDFPLKGGVG